MDQSLIDFLTLAMKTAFEDLDIFCQAGLSISQEDLVVVPQYDEKSLGNKDLVGISLEFGEDGEGMLLMPIEAAICLGASMMLLPKERVHELMEACEMDEEDLLTVQEAGNLLCGSLARVMRENELYLEEVRLKEILINPVEKSENIGLMGQEAVRYMFMLLTDRSPGFPCELHLPTSIARALAPQDAMFREVRSAEGQAESGTMLGHYAQQNMTDAQSPEAVGVTGHEAELVNLNSSQEDRPRSEGGVWSTHPNVRAMQDLLSGGVGEGDVAGQLNGCHVLIVDDSWVARRCLAGLLRPYGCFIHDARDAKGARQIIHSHQIDVILLDLLLPGENGLEFCSRLRAEGVLQYTSVVVISGVSTSENVVQAVRAGASFFLVKPVSEPYLVKVVQGVLRQYRTSYMRRSNG